MAEKYNNLCLHVINWHNVKVINKIYDINEILIKNYFSQYCIRGKRKGRKLYFYSNFRINNLLFPYIFVALLKCNLL